MEMHSVINYMNCNCQTAHINYCIMKSMLSENDYDSYSLHNILDAIPSVKYHKIKHVI